MLGASVQGEYPVFSEEATYDATQVFTEELNKRSIMPMELMQARTSPKFAETAERVNNEYQAMKIAIQKTVQYVKDRQAEIDRLVGGFTHEAGIKLSDSSCSSSGVSSDDESRMNLKRSLSEESAATQSAAPKRVKHGISDILGGAVKEEKPVVVKEEPAAQFNQYNALQMNFNRIQQEQAAQHSQLQQQQQSAQAHYAQAHALAQANHQAQLLAQAQARIQGGQAQTAPVVPAPGQQRYWSDAMYSLLLRAQQSQQITEKLPEGRVPSQHSDSGHESGNADSGSEQEVIDVQNGAAPTIAPAEVPQPTHQVKPAWIQKRMDKLKRKRAARENGEPDIDVEGDDDEDDLPNIGGAPTETTPDLVNAELGPAIIGGVGTGVITKDANGKTLISCKQCRWTLRKWESWAKKRNMGTLPGLDIKSDPSDLAPVDFLSLDTTEELVRWMSNFIREIRKDSGEAYQIDSITAFAFSLQKVLKETGRQVDILRNEKFTVFLEAMNEAMDSSVKTVVLQPTPRQDEETLWQSGELGYHSPEALTQTLVMIIVKHLKIRSSQAHRDMEMSDFEKVKIFNPSNPTQLLEIYRYRDSRGNAKRGEIVPNLAKPERCPVRILDYYLEKRPPAIRHSGPFYLWPSDQKSIDRMSWFRVKPLSKKYLLKCLCRIKQTNLHDV
jgi:hypothetical protein